MVEGVRDARLGYNQGRASLGHITLASRSKTIMRGDKYWDTNMTAAKKQNLMKKSILWRGNMVQVSSLLYYLTILKHKDMFLCGSYI